MNYNFDSFSNAFVIFKKRKEKDHTREKKGTEQQGAAGRLIKRSRPSSSSFQSFRINIEEERGNKSFFKA